MDKKARLILSIAILALSIIVGVAKGRKNSRQIERITSNIEYSNALQAAYRQYSVMERVFDMYAENVPDTAADLKKKLPEVQAATDEAELLLVPLMALEPPDSFAAQHNRLKAAAQKELQLHEVLIRIYSDNLPLSAKATSSEYRKIKNAIPAGERFADLGEVLYNEFYHKYVV